MIVNGLDRPTWIGGEKKIAGDPNGEEAAFQAVVTKHASSTLVPRLNFYKIIALTKVVGLIFRKY